MPFSSIYSHISTTSTSLEDKSILKVYREDDRDYTYTGISAEWDPNVKGPPAEVILHMHNKPTGVYNTTDTIDDGGGTIGTGGVVVRTEEALIVIFVLLLWIAAIALFFNRWGKIRMLEPYQPKFQQQHRTSCPIIEQQQVTHRQSLSRSCGTTCIDYTANTNFLHCHPSSYQHAITTCAAHSLAVSRPRQNSVFAQSTNTMALIPESPPRRSHSVSDIPDQSKSSKDEISHQGSRSFREDDEIHHHNANSRLVYAQSHLEPVVIPQQGYTVTNV